MLRISRKFFEAVKLNDRPAYQIAWEAGVHPVTLSRIIRGCDPIYPRDARVLAVGKVLNLTEEECFSET